MVQWDEPGTAGRRRNRKKRGFATRRDAREWESGNVPGLQAAAGRRGGDRAERTVAEYLTVWVAGRAIARSSRATYRMHIARHVVPFIGGVRLRDLTVDDLNGLYRRLEQTGGLRWSSGGRCRCRRRRFATSTGCCTRRSMTR